MSFTRGSNVLTAPYETPYPMLALDPGLTFWGADGGMLHMKKIPMIVVMLISAGTLSACIGLPSFSNMFYPVERNNVAYARSEKNTSAAAANSRAPLDVPPELRKDIEVPMPDKVATETARGRNKGGDRVSVELKKAIAGKAVSLDARVYTQRTARVFSAVIDAMTSLNMPVDSVDSPSGTITTAWIRFDSNNTNAYLGSVMGMFGMGPVHTRHRFIVRVFRMGDGKTLLQIRTLAQQFIGRHWVNRILKRKVAKELFSAVEERIGAPVPGTTTAESLPKGNPGKQ